MPMPMPSANMASSSRDASVPLTVPDTARIEVVTDMTPPMDRSIPRVNRLSVWPKATMASGNTAEKRTSMAPVDQGGLNATMATRARRRRYRA